jgi:hypothetical protein
VFEQLLRLALGEHEKPFDQAVQIAFRKSAIRRAHANLLVVVVELESHLLTRFIVRDKIRQACFEIAKLFGIMVAEAIHDFGEEIFGQRPRLMHPNTQGNFPQRSFLVAVSRIEGHSLFVRKF